MGQIKSPPRVLDEYTQRQYIETKARSILNKASPDILPNSLFKPTSYKTDFEFDSQSEKNRYLKILKEIQVLKSRIVTNPSGREGIINAFVLLNTRFTPSPKQISKFIDFLLKDRVAPTNMSLKDTIFYMMTYDENFDLADTDSYGINQSKQNESVLFADRSEGNLK